MKIAVPANDVHYATEAGLIRHINERVRNGARVLDAVKPGWFVALREAEKNDGFNIQDGEACVLGNAYASEVPPNDPSMNGYKLGWRKVKAFIEMVTGREPSSSSQFGFDIYGYIPDKVKSPKVASLIEEAWIREAKRRRVVVR